MSSNLLTLMVSATFLSLALTRAQGGENQHMAKLEQSDGSESTTQKMPGTEPVGKQENINSLDNILDCSSYGGDTDLASILLHTASAGNTTEVRCLFKAGVNPSLADDYNNTALYMAAKRGHVEICNLLIAAGADVNARNSAGLTPLHSAVTNGHISVVRVLLNFRVRVDAASVLGLTPLHMAASKGNFQMVKMLIFKGADVDVADIYGNTALHSAARRGDLEAFKQLFMLGADRNIANARGKLPIEVATSGDIPNWNRRCEMWFLGFSGSCLEAYGERMRFMRNITGVDDLKHEHDNIIYGALKKQ